MSHPLTRTLPGVRPSFNYLVMQYLLKTKNQMNFDPVVAFNHFVEPGVVESPLTGGANAQSLEKRVRFASFVESLASEKTDLAEERKLTSFIRGLNQPETDGAAKATMSLFPFSGATSFFPRDKVGVYNNQVFEQAREQILQRLRKKCWNVMAKDEKVLELLEKFIDQGGVGELTKGMEMMIEIMMRNRRIPYGYNFYLNEVKRMRSLLSKGTETNTFIESVKVKSVYQSAALVAQDFAFQLRNKSRSVRSVFSQIVKDILVGSEKGVEGIHVLCSGRLQGAEIARSESASYGKTSRTTFDQKKDYAFAEVSTRYGITGVKVWISYRKGR